MTASLRTLAFGELEPGGLWGAAWAGDRDGAALAVVGGGNELSVLSDRALSAGAEDEDWRLEGGGADLAVTPVGEPVPIQAPEDAIDGWDQLCRVTGTFAQDGTEGALDCLGLRTSWAGTVELERYDSIRAVSAWFEPDEGLALTAFRPRKAKAHDHDLLAATVIAPDASAPVEDPRLSTTYGAEGWPVRAGLELWLAGSDDEQPDRQYPRRASGEATGARAEALAGVLEVRAQSFRWHSRGRAGAGVYLLARRR